MNPGSIDTREYVFPIVSMTEKDGVYQVASIKFLGTGFFVSKKGDAITAAHVLLDFEQGRKLVAILCMNGKEEFYPISMVLKWPEYDFSLFKVLAPENQYFHLSTMSLFLGTDIRTVGITAHSTDEDGGKQMRLFKGYVVTASSDRVELDFPVPAGMSGSPVFFNDTHLVVAYATGRVRSEELEDSFEELEELGPQRDRLTIYRNQRVTSYGIARTFKPIINVLLPALNNRTLAQFLSDQNA